MIRVTYIPGPGDVVGTYKYWQDGIEDPRIPVVTYSSMMYTSIKKLGGELQIITTNSKPHDIESWITFSQIQELSETKNYFQAQIERVYSIRKQLNSYKPDIVVVGSDIPVFLLFILKSKQWKLCLSIHNTYWPSGRARYKDFKSKIKYLIMKANIQITEGAICTSLECENQYRSLMNRHVPVFTETPTVRHEFVPNKSDSVRKIAFIGRIEVNKGALMLAEVIKELSESYSDIYCYFAGSGSAQNQLEHYISVCELNSSKYLGRLPAEGIHELLDSVDLLVVPTLSSFNEGLALVGFEAAFHLVPCLYSDVVPAKDYFHDACSVFRADDKEDLKMKLINLIEEPEYYLSLRKNLKKYVEEIKESNNSWGELVIRVIKELSHE